MEALNGVDQIIVIDSFSLDSTPQIVKSHGVDLVSFTWNGKCPKKKQWALELTEIRNDWVLFLDADEIISKDLLGEIKAFLEMKDLDKYGAGIISLDYVFLGRQLKHGHKVKKISVLNRKFSYFPEVDDLDVKNMWEVEGHYQPIVTKEVYKFKERITHLDPDLLFDYFSRHNRYSDWEAYLLVNPSAKKTVANMRSKQGQLFDRISFKPLVFFVYSFFVRSGWRDGKAGFNYAVALSFYYWQIHIKYLEHKVNTTL